MPLPFLKYEFFSYRMINNRMLPLIDNTKNVSDLPRKLSTEEAPSGCDPSVVDITYYAPWGNLAIFYNDFGYADGLIKLGKIDQGIEEFNKSRSFNVSIELIK